MQVNLYTSNTINGSCLAVIDALGAKNKPDTKHIFIAPDKFSLSIETNIFRRLNLQAAFNIDVVSFMRLTTKALGRAGGSCLTKEGALLVFKKVLNRNADKLTHYAGVARMPSFAAEMYAVITSFRNNCYTPQDIIDAAGSFSKATKNKALDIALLYNQYILELASGYPDATSRTDKFIAEAATLDIIRDSHIYIGGFAAFSAKQYQIIDTLMRYAKSVSIATTPYNGGGNASLYPYFTLERLKDIAQLNGANLTITPCDQHLQEPFASINKGLFSLSKAVSAPPTDKFFIVEEDTIYNEINGIAKEILHLITRKGLRYKDIAIVCCNDNYRELISSIFMRYSIPCFIDKKHRLKDAAIVRHLFAALDVVEYGFRQDKVLKYIKNPLCGINPADADLFENYVYENCISYKGFSSPFKGENAVEVEQTRQKLTQSLQAFTARKQTAIDFATACNAFLASQEVTDILTNRLDTLADAALQAGNLQAAQKLHAILQQVGTLLAEDTFDFGECKNILLSCIEGTEFSLIPQHADSIFVGNIQDSLYDNIKVLFIMSATVEVLPPTHNYRAIISAKDFVQMQDAGLHLYPTPPDLIKEDMFMLLDLFTKSSGSIYISYSNVTPLGQQSRASSVVQELRDITSASTVCLSQKHSVHNTKDTQELSTTLATQENAFFEFLQLLPKVTYSGDMVSQKLDILYNSLSLDRQKRLARLLYLKDVPTPPNGANYFGKDEQGRYTVNATQLETYFACPYLHHLQNGIKLTPRKDGRLQRNSAGTIIHSVLEQFFKRTKGIIRELTLQQVRQIGEEVIQNVFNNPRIVGSSRNLFTLNSLAIIRKECIRIIVALTQKINMSAYTPYLLEYSFGSKDEVVLHTQQADFVFRGKADRVDTRQYGDTIKAIAIDYKTGSEKKVDDYFGSNMQLWIYLKALSHDGYAGQGAFYLHIKDTISQKDEPFLLNGYFNIQEIDSLDTAFYSREDGQSLTVNAKMSKGECKLSLTPQEFDALIDYHCTIATLALQELLDGTIIKSPKSGYDCNNCGYYLVCGGAQPQDFREVKKGRQIASEEADNA